MDSFFNNSREKKKQYKLSNCCCCFFYLAYAPPGYNNKKPKNITCKQCTAKQTASLQCMTCTKTKPLEQFAKVKKFTHRSYVKRNKKKLIMYVYISQNQRKHAEKARCLKCMKKREDEDMNDSDPDYSSDEDSDDPNYETWHDIM